METRHLKLDYEEALAAKKQLLTFELNLLQILRKMSAYKLLRKKEQGNSNKIKTSVAAMRSKINALESTFPTDKKPKRKRERREIKAPRKYGRGLQRELDEIKRKLARLNQEEV